MVIFSEASIRLSGVLRIAVLVVLLAASMYVAGDVGAADDLFSAQHVQKDVSDNDRAFFAGDVEVILNMTLPRVIEMMGGVEVARAGIKAMMAPMKAMNSELVSESFPSPPQFLSGGGNHFVVVPVLAIMRFGDSGRKQEIHNFYVGMLDATSNSWKYVDGSKINHQLAAVLFPGFPADFPFPKVYTKAL